MIDLPCPYCGDKPRGMADGYIFCDCGASAPIEVWNTRAERTSKRKLSGWQPGKLSQEVHYVCGECEEPLRMKDNYCPNCGAKVVKRNEQ